MLPDFRKGIAFGRFQGFARSSFWQEQRADEYAALVERYWQENKRNNPEKNLSQWHSVHQKSHMDWPEIEPWPPRSEARD
jgi:hypothetical protein